MRVYKPEYNQLPLSCINIIWNLQIVFASWHSATNLFNFAHFRTNTRQNNTSVRGPKLQEPLPTYIQTSLSLIVLKKNY